MNRAESGKSAYIALMVFIVVAAVYAPAVMNGFVTWDDDVYIFRNDHIRSLDPAFLNWAFLGSHGGNWHPLTWIFHAAVYAFWGLNPIGYHLASVLLHALNSSVTVILSLRLISAYSGGGLSSRAAAIAALVTGLLFGLHPLHVESVAWVSELKDVLYSLFYMLSLIAYVDSAVSGSRARYALSAALFLLAVMSKPMAVTLPVIMMIIDRAVLQRTLRTSLVRTAPFFILSCVASVIAFLAQGSAHAVVSTQAVPVGPRFLIAAMSLFSYLRRMLLPFGLSPLYPFPTSSVISGLGYPIALIAAIAFTVASVFMIWKDRSRIFPAVWLYYVITLLPTLGIIQVGSQPSADRYTYLALNGFFLLIGLAVARLFDARGDGYSYSGYVRAAEYIVVLTFVVCMSFATVRQINYWKNGVALWSRVIELGSNRRDFLSLAHNSRGGAYFLSGRYNEAVQDYTESLRLDPGASGTYRNRGLTYVKLGRAQEAEQDFRKSDELSGRTGNRK